MQWFGVPKWAEGPTADYLATSLKQAPGRVPERPSGESPDILGKPTLRLTLQTQGQHIGMDKSSSNVGTADASVRHGCHEGCAPQDRRAEDHRQVSCAGEARYISPKRRGMLRHSGFRSLFC